MDNRLVERALDKTADSLTPALRAHAAAAGWPVELARSLTVIHSAEGLQVSYPPEMHDRIMSAEFGTERARPMAALNTFFQTDKGAERITKETADQSGEVLAFVDRLFR